MRTSALVKTKVCPTGFPPVAKTLPKAVRRLVAELKPEKIILFGSYAYGTPTSDSDVDLLIIMKTRARPIDRYVLASNALNPREFPVDIIVKTPREIQVESRKKNFFLHEVLSKGKVIYERNT